jgi:hypothetical protein
MVRPFDIEVARALMDEVELPDSVEAAMAVWPARLLAEITQRARARGVPMPDLNTLAPIPMVNFCFPHYFLLPFFGNMASYRCRPTGPESCLFEIWSLSLYPEDEKREKPVAPVAIRHDDPSWPLISAQDFANLPLQQQGLHAQGFEYMRLSREFEGAISSNHRAIDAFLAGENAANLVKVMNVACSSIDTPVRYESLI